MILQGNLYVIETLDKSADKVLAVIQLDAGHAIFRGHFPGQPVLPGVCMMQLVKEIMETALGGGIRLVRADTLKFLRVIDPRGDSRLRIECRYTAADGESLQLSGDLFAGDEVAFRMKALFAIGN